jgi:hypothetical protein
MTRDELLAGLRRFGLLSIAIVFITAGASLALGVITGTSVRRSLSLGFYIAGVGCIVFGLFQAVRPPVRREAEAGRIERPPSVLGGLIGGAAQHSGPVRWATADEVGESYATAGLLVTLGVVLIALGAFLDDRRSAV